MWILPLPSMETFLSLKWSLWVISCWLVSQKYACNFWVKHLAVPVGCLLRVDITCDQGWGTDPSWCGLWFFKLRWSVTENIHTVLLRVNALHWQSGIALNVLHFHGSLDVFGGSKKGQSVPIHTHLWSLDWGSFSVGLLGLTQYGWVVDVDQRAGLNITELILMRYIEHATLEACACHCRRQTYVKKYYWIGIF